jgi:N utilization substance protein A
MASELFNTIDALSREKGIDPQIVVSAVEDAIVVATRKYYKTQENLRAELDRDSGQIRAFVVKQVVESAEQIEDATNQITSTSGA